MKKIIMLIATLALSCAPATAAPRTWSPPVMVLAQSVTIPDAEHIAVQGVTMRLYGVCVPAAKRARAKQLLSDMLQSAEAAYVQRTGGKGEPVRLLITNRMYYATKQDVGNRLVTEGLAKRC